MTRFLPERDERKSKKAGINRIRMVVGRLLRLSSMAFLKCLLKLLHKKKAAETHK